MKYEFLVTLDMSLLSLLIIVINLYRIKFVILFKKKIILTSSFCKVVHIELSLLQNGLGTKLIKQIWTLLYPLKVNEYACTLTHSSGLV